MKHQFIFEGLIEEIHQGKRLDQALSQMCPEHSRSRLTQWIKQGALELNGEVCVENKRKVKQGDGIVLRAEYEDVQEMVPEEIPLEIVFEDDDVIVLNKPAGLVVHPAAGNRSGTLLNALLHHCSDLTKIPRAGIVHRLDKGTTGLMMVAKTLTAHTSLVQQLQARSVKRVYHALIQGLPRRQSGTINAPIDRDPTNRIKMAVSDAEEAKEAITHYRLLDRKTASSLIECRLETGRTHQIRVHMTHIGHPLLADATYSGHQRYPAGLSPEQRKAIDDFGRPALHAKSLSFIHPVTLEPVTLETEYPEDFQTLLAALK
jgi:23S rRNA pseudouridine1911/1915/1917 synthase